MKPSADRRFFGRTKMSDHFFYVEYTGIEVFENLNSRDIKPRGGKKYEEREGRDKV